MLTDTFSSLVAPATPPSALARLLGIFGQSCSSRAREQFALQDAQILAWIGPDYHVRVGILPTFVGSHGVLALSLNDTLDSATPASLLPHLLGLAVSTLVPADLAKALDLPRLCETTKAPSNANAPGPALDGGQRPTASVGNFPGEPAFACIPLVCPVCPGDASKLLLCPRVDRQVSEETLSNLPDYLRAWLIGMVWLFANNDFTCLSGQPKVFAEDSAEVKSLLELAQSCKLDLVGTTAAGTVTPCDPFSAESTEYKEFFKRQKLRLQSHEADMSRKTPQGTEMGMPTGPVWAAFLQELQKTTSKKQKDDTTETDETSARYSLFLASIEDRSPSNNGSELVLLPGALSEDFQRVLSTSKVSDAVSTFQDSFLDMLQSFGSRISIEKDYHWDPRVFQAAEITQLRKFGWLRNSLNADPQGADNYLSPVVLLPPRAHDSCFATHVDENFLISRQEQVGEDASRINKKSTKVFSNGSIASFRHLDIWHSNVHALFRWMLATYDANNPPYLLKLVDGVFDTLHTRLGQQWVATHAAQQHLPVSLLVDFSTLFSIFVGVACHRAFISQLQAGTLSDGAIFTDALRHQRHVLSNLDAAIRSMNCGVFTSMPAFGQRYLVSPPATKEEAGPTSPQKRKGTPAKDSDKQKKGKSDATQLGVLVWKGAGDPPVPSQRFLLKKSGKEVGACRDFLYVGRACSKLAANQPCPLFHLTQSGLHKDQPKEVQANLCKWVANTKHLEWNEGAKPQDVSALLRSGVVSPNVLLPDQSLLEFTHPSPTAPAVARLLSAASDDSDASDDEKEDCLPTITPVSFTAEEQEALIPYQTQMFQGRHNSGAPLTTLEKRLLLQEVPDDVQLRILHPRGKDSIDRCFMTQRTFRHVWIFLLKGLYLEETALHALFAGFPHVLLLYSLLREHEFVDFRPLKNPPDSSLPAVSTMFHWSRMFTALLLHYNFNVASAVRYIGGIHTGSHRDWPSLNAILTRYNINQSTITNLRRVFEDGCPNFCNAFSTDDNYRTFVRNGNHASVYEYPEEAMKAAMKDFIRSHSLVANPLLSIYLYDTHITPQGLVMAPGKNPRSIFDSSHHPCYNSMAINDWTSKETEPEVIFPLSFTRFLIWIYNLRITYPDAEIYIGDDDISGAFRHAKWNPNLVGMHSFQLHGLLFFGTGLSFGDTTSPSNFEPIAVCRRDLAQQLWFEPDTISKILHLLPSIKMAPAPSSAEIASFTPAEADSLNVGVMRNGARTHPGYDHHVDDCLYADVAEHLPQTVSSSILALYYILGFPDKEKGIRDCVSWEKFVNIFSHERRTLGWLIDSRHLTVSLPSDKRDKLLQLVNHTRRHPKVTLRGLATLLGHLANATTVCRRMRCSYYNLQRYLRTLLKARFEKVRGYFFRKEICHRLSKQLPSEFQYRIGSIVGKTIARFLWNANLTYTLTPPIIRELRTIAASLEADDWTDTWRIYIPQLIPRDPHFTSFGDASLIGGGGFCHVLHYWFRVVWSPTVVAATQRSAVDDCFTHINVLEFLVAFLQVVALVIRYEAEALPMALRQHFPAGLPKFPLLLNRTDNTATRNWIEDVSTSSAMAIALVHLYAQLLERLPVYASKASLDTALGHFPSESGAFIGPTLSALLRCHQGSTKSAKALGQDVSRWFHWLRFCSIMKLTDAWVLRNVPHVRRVYQFGLYAMYLANGHSISGNPLGSQSISGYLKAAADLCSEFCGRDPRYNLPSDTTMSPLIKKVLAEVIRHEGVPKKQHPYTTEMHEHLVKSNRDEDVDPDSLEAALENWNAINLCAGCRRIEYAQTAANRALGHHELADRPLPDGSLRCYAFCLEDLRFEDHNRRSVSLLYFLAHPTRVARVWLRFYCQKNGQHGEEKLFCRNDGNPMWCFVTNLWHILKRFHRLVGLRHTKVPIAVFKQHNRTEYVHDRAITKCLKGLGRAVYNKPKGDLKYTPHSLRIGATVLLHAAGAPEHRIKFILRWRSDSFMHYLRNVAHLSHDQNSAINKLSSMPDIM